MSCTGYRNPPQQTLEDTINFLTWEQFPAVLDKSIEYFAVLPRTGIYKHFNTDVKDFGDQLLENTGRQFTLSGVGSLIDYDTYGHILKRPSPQLEGTGCEANSLCLEPSCFCLTEGMIESNNILQNICWSLSMPCLKDQFYSDRMFERKMTSYFGMFFEQAPAVMQAYQRTRLIKEATKVLCLDTNITYTGAGVPTAGLSLPFYVNPADPVAFPDLTALPGTSAVGGVNLVAFAHYLAPRMFTGTFASGMMEDVKIYGLKQDYMVAKEQTKSVADTFMDNEVIRAILMSMHASPFDERMDTMMGEFIHDPLFPTFKEGTTGLVEPITQEILEASTIAGYVQTSNPEHILAEYRGLLFVPANWRFNLVEPPRDDFSGLGLGEGLNFRFNTPGVFPVLSSSMFARNTIGEDGVVMLGQTVTGDGRVVMSASGLRERERSLQEAIRTEVLQTYVTTACNDSTSDQLPMVGAAMTPQARADGFLLKSTAYIGTDVKGTARPVLLIFKTDTPRHAKPIVVCTTEEVEVETDACYSLVDCCPGGQTFVILTFDRDVSTYFSSSDEVVYRTGARGQTYLGLVSAVSGTVVHVTSSADPQELLPCCTGSPDDYGTRGELLNCTTATATSGEVMKALYDVASDSIFLELFFPMQAALAAAAGTMTLDNGNTIEFVLTANSSCVFVQIEADTDEDCDFSTLDCHCLVNAVIVMD